MHTSTSLLALVLPVLASAAGTCTSSGSIAWPPVGDCATPGKFDTAVQNCRACCMNDQPCFTTCLKAAGIGRRSTADETFSGFVPDARGLGRRAVDLTCDVNEGCYKFTDGSLLCLSLGTGKYHDDVGGNGDYYSGVYTGPDGKVQTGTSTATATATGNTQLPSSTAQGTRSANVAQTTSAGAASAATSSAAAPASTGAAPAMARAVNHGLTNAGILGLVVGLAL
ncbi:hypothetical protein C7974DRAFT_372045 [Boeremia exigua]|uniref:uncharacterized protein n=1 Tax=Boeremia exigua TaxID=749465 RepID=UPI001E8DF1F9|nr:uncharacterized protein C7974DRAFT_372045 [Boeremia exigua]KAH6642050.1 hypothetical protein C7974DRAFT_372045 [Boeremia exigua]